MKANNKVSKLDQWFARGYAAHQVGHFAEAERFYRRVLRQQPTDVETLYLLGTLIAQQSRSPDEAVTLLERARTLRPGHPETLNNLGLALQKAENYPAARSCFEEAIALKPDYAFAYNNLGRLYEQQGELDNAIMAFQRASELNPNYPDACYNLGLLLNKQERLHEAEVLFRRCCELAPQEARMWDDLGTVLKESGHPGEAELCFRMALEREPQRFSAWNNLGAVREVLGDFNGALAAYQHAQALHPEDPMPQWNQAFALLSLGRLVEGWAQHEIRWPIFGKVDMPCPVWEGEELPEGVLLVLAEQGLGDEILFASCIPDATRRVGQIIIECSPRLAPLFARSFPEVWISAEASRAHWHWLAALPTPDRAVCAGSLPRLFRNDLSDFPKINAYLYADVERIAYWQRRLEKLGVGLKIGICWRSGVAAGKRAQYYTMLEDWQSLFAIAGIHFINLQYDECITELTEARQRFGVEIVNFTEIDLRNDQDEVAALMCALDLIISAPTAVAALAGALGCPVWRYNLTYGWTSLGTDYLPFSLTTRLFDKTHPEEPWALIFEKMATELRSWVIGEQRPQWPDLEVTPAPAMTPRMATNFLTLALNARTVGDLDKAQSHCQCVLRRYPEHADAWHLLGVLRREQGAPEEALAAFARAHACNPQEPTVLVNRGRVLQDLGRGEPALADFHAALALDETSIEARLSLGELLNVQGLWNEALTVLQPALALAADNDWFAAQVHYAIARALRHQRQLSEAEQHLREAVRLDPAYPDAHNGLGNLLRDQGQLDAALACYQAALALRPDSPEFHNNLGNALHDLGELPESEAAYREALRLRPDYADAWSNLGNLLTEFAAPREAIQAYRRALELRPDDAVVHWNLAPALLQQGELTEGWIAYEWRWPSGTQGQLLPWYPDWKGEELTGRKILLLPEQGLGDEIMFASCIPDVLTCAEQVVLVCQERLAALYARSFPTALIVAMPAGLVQAPRNLPVCDYQIAIGSLPRWLRARIGDFPDRPAYLRADPVRVDGWRARLDELGPGLRIGICWRSGLRIGIRHRYYPTLADWEPILKTPGVVFVNLQYDDCAEALAEARARFGVVIHSFPELDLRDDQEGVAALMSALDGVISAPTAVAELAAALGRPVLRYGIGWTSLGTDYMPWHPTMRLFEMNRNRQEPWRVVTSAMAAALSAWVAQADAAVNPAEIPLQLADTRHGLLLIGGAGSAARDLLRTGDYAAETVTLLRSLLRPGDWVVEVGADLGGVTLPLARAVGTEGLVIACESSQDQYRLLCANLALNEIRQVHAECMTLDGAIPTPEDGAGAAWRRTRLPLRATIDALDLPRCDLLRIGADVDARAVLAGARATLARCKPFLQIETRADPAALAACLSALEYAWHLQDHSDASVALLAYPAVKVATPP